MVSFQTMGNLLLNISCAGTNHMRASAAMARHFLTRPALADVDILSETDAHGAALHRCQRGTPL